MTTQILCFITTAAVEVALWYFRDFLNEVLQ